MVNRAGFSLLEVVVALLVFTIGALAASGLAIHAATIMTRAQQVERAAWRASALVASLAEAGVTGQGMLSDRAAAYAWSVADGVQVTAITHAATDTIHLVAPRLTPLLLLRAQP